MGAYLSEPITTKQSEDGEGNKLIFGACCMQGWRVSQEDAHNCLPNFDKDSSFFAVYDGHGGAEVAVYLSRRFPDFFKNSKIYLDEKWEEALRESYIKIDASIPTQPVISELQKIAKQASGDNKGESSVDYEDENVSALYEEATMPLDKLVALYKTKTGQEDGKVTVPESNQPCSSKVLQSPSSSKGEGSPRSSVCGNINNAVSTNSHDEDKVETKDAINESVEKVEDVSSPSKAAPPSPPAIPTNSNNKTPGNSAADSETEPLKIVPDKSSENRTETDSGGKEAAIDTKEIAQANEETLLKNGNQLEDPSEPIKNGTCDSPIKNDVVNVQIENNISSPIKVRKGKVHPPSPSISPAKKKEPTIITRNRSHQETYDVLKKAVLNACNMSDSDESSESADDYIAGMSDDDDDEDESLANSSSTNDAEENEEDDDDDDDDDEEDEDDDDDRFLNDIQEPGFDSGSTAVVAFMRWEGDRLGLWVANAGDSRCVVCRNGKAVDMSFDHKPEEQKETRRIISAGGKVTHDGRVNGGLNLSRAIGDHSYKQNSKVSAEEQMITPVPDIQHMVLDPESDDFVVLACDGIWNSMSSQEVVAFISKELLELEGNKLSKICEKLFDVCLSPDTVGDGTGCDNMTAIIVSLPKISPTAGVKRSLTSEEDEAEAKKLKLETSV